MQEAKAIAEMALELEDSEQIKKFVRDTLPMINF